jgi:hypothetical protein
MHIYGTREGVADVGVPALAGIPTKDRLKAGLQRHISNRVRHNDSRSHTRKRLTRADPSGKTGRVQKLSDPT